MKLVVEWWGKWFDILFFQCHVKIDDDNEEELQGEKTIWNIL